MSPAQPQTRILQLALAGVWTIVALLQFHSAYFSSQLVLGTILGNAETRPRLECHLQLVAGEPPQEAPRRHAVRRSHPSAADLTRLKSDHNRP
jgi:hypothetical protein